MPRIGQPTRRDVLVKTALAVWSKFQDPAAWRRSKKGNLWRNWEGLTLTIFERDLRYRWAIAGADGLRYSPGGFEVEDHAIEALGEALGLSDF